MDRVPLIPSLRPPPALSTPGPAVARTSVFFYYAPETRSAQSLSEGQHISAGAAAIL